MVNLEQVTKALAGVEIVGVVMAHNQLSVSLKGALPEFVLATIEKAVFAKTMFA